MNPREEFIKGLTGAEILGDGEFGCAAMIFHVGFSGSLADTDRKNAMLAMLDSGLWTELVCYLDLAGPAIQASRNPQIGPIQRSCAAHW